MPTNLIPAAAQPASDGGAYIHQWLHGLIEIAKVCVIFAGGYFSHWLLLRRDVGGRKRAFLAFMEQWRAEVDRWQWFTGGRSEHYQRATALFRGEARRIEDDLPESKREAFGALVSKTCGFTPAAVEAAHDSKGQKDLLAAIDAIIKFIET
jgi:hypothetical protein